MDSYYEVSRKLNEVIEKLESMQQLITKCELWIDDSIVNCIQNEEIAGELEKMNDKLKEAISEVEDTRGKLRG